jgi:cytochrome c biogenesis protein CcmG, thiol:disulfide interchange protein DsbE
MAKVSPLMLAPPLIFAGLAAMFWFGMAREDPDQLPSALAGRQAPAVAVTQLGPDAPFTDDDLRQGDVTLVNFWASWCAPCRVEHPNLEALAATGLTIFGVNYKDEPANALGFLEELGNPYVGMGADSSGRMGLNWGLYGVPETYVIDGQGNIVLRHAGPITQRVMESSIMPAIEKARAAGS